MAFLANGMLPSGPHVIRQRARMGVAAAAAGDSMNSNGQAPRTVSEAVVGARKALRAFRDARATRPSDPAEPAAQGGSEQASASQQLTRQGSQQWWITVELPLPVKQSLLTSTGVSGQASLIRSANEGDWPGGMPQRFRALKPLVEEMLEGYEWKFLGLLESDADGVGLWSAPGMTLIGSITNPTFPSLLKLLKGGYGSRVTEPDHVIVAVNPQWSRSADMGQPWDRGLKDSAAAVLNESNTIPRRCACSETDFQASLKTVSPWEALYTCRMIRTSRGSTGMLIRSWPGPWELYATPVDDARELGPRVLRSRDKPNPAQIIEALQGCQQEMAARARQLKQEEKQGMGIPWL